MTSLYRNGPFHLEQTIATTIVVAAFPLQAILAAAAAAAAAQ